MAAFGSLSLVLRGWEVFGWTHRQMFGRTDRCSDTQMFGRTNILSVTDRCSNAQTNFVGVTNRRSDGQTDEQTY